MRAKSVLAISAAVVLATAGRALGEESTNLVRNAGLEEGVAGWTLPSNFSVVAETARSGTHSLRLVNTNRATYLLARQSLSFKPGMRYRYGAWIKTRDVRGDDSGATLCMEWSGPQGWIGGSYAEGKKGNQDWFHVEGVTGPMPPAANSVSVELYLRRGMTGTAWFDDVSVTEEYPPALQAVMLQPNYRGRLAANAVDQRVIVRADVGEMLPGGLKPEQTRLVYSVIGVEPVVRGVVNTAKAGHNTLSLDARELRPGNYRLAVVLEATNSSQILGQHVLELHKLSAEAPTPTVFIDDHNRTMVNGKPFFPLGWYFGSGSNDKKFREHIDRLAASPFNTIMCYGVNSGTTNNVREYLDYLASRNLKIIYSIKDVFADTRWYQEPVLGWRGEENIVRNIVQTFGNHPALLAWYLNDELPLTMRARLEQRQQLVARLDPNHPTWAVLYQVDDLSGYLDTADVLGTDPYPVPDKPVTVAAEWTRKSRAVSDGRRPVWMVPQAFDWAVYRKDPAKGRAPTLDEEMVMTYLCLIHGANGLIYYSYSDLLRDRRVPIEQRWADMLVVGKEVKQLEPALLSAVKPPPLEVWRENDAVRFALRADEADNVYVMMANPDNAHEASVRVVGAGNSVGRLLRHAEMRAMPPPAAPMEREVHLGRMDAATLVLEPRR